MRVVLLGLKARRSAFVALAVLAALALSGLIATHLAAQAAKSWALRWLGPGSQIAEIDFSLDQVELRGLRIPGVAGWPAADALRVDRVVIHPDWMSLLGDEIHLRSVEFHGVYFSVLRTQDRQLRFLPTILPRPKRPPGAEPPRNVRIDRANADGGRLDLYDASILQPAHRLYLLDVQGEARDMLFPRLTTRTTFQLQARSSVDGDPGSLRLTGWTEFSKRDSSMQIDIRNLDVAEIEPYLLRRLETGVESGRFDLQMYSEVRDRQITAPGHMRFIDLKLKPAEGPVARFMGLPRRGVIQALEDRKGRIDLDFEMKGPLGDTRFSLNEAFAFKATVAMGAVLGLTLGGVVEGLGSLGGRSLDAVGDLFGGKDEPDADGKDPAARKGGKQ